MKTCLHNSLISVSSNGDKCHERGRKSVYVGNVAVILRRGFLFWDNHVKVMPTQNLHFWYYRSRVMIIGYKCSEIPHVFCRTATLSKDLSSEKRWSWSRSN